MKGVSKLVSKLAVQKYQLDYELEISKLIVEEAEVQHIP